MTDVQTQRLTQILSLERIDRDIFRGGAVPSLLPRTFGGQVAAQSLMAAVRTVGEERVAHSLHGYFLRPGVPTAPTVFTVRRVRDGGSFTTREVHAVQDGETIFTMTASFQAPVRGERVERQHEMPSCAGPEASEVPSTGEYFFAEWSDWEIRQFREDSPTDLAQALSRQRMWFRYRHRLPDDPMLHIGGLVYLSDMTLFLDVTLLMLSQRGDLQTQVKIASLDHAVWIMRPFRVDDWLLYDQVSPSAQGGRALVQGKLFDQFGNLVAVVAQEGGIKVVPGSPERPAWVTS